MARDAQILGPWLHKYLNSVQWCLIFSAESLHFFPLHTKMCVISPEPRKKPKKTVDLQITPKQCVVVQNLLHVIFLSSGIWQ
jgi:hypothetical protein